MGAHLQSHLGGLVFHLLSNKLPLYIIYTVPKTKYPKLTQGDLLCPLLQGRDEKKEMLVSSVTTSRQVIATFISHVLLNL